MKLSKSSWLVMILTVSMAGCVGNAEEDENDTTESVGPAQQALNYTFPIPKNPTSTKSKALRATVKPGAGGTIKWFTIGDDSPFFEYYTGVLNSNSTVIRTANLACANYGTSYVNVEYTGPKPQVTYWWTDCQ